MYFSKSVVLGVMGASVFGISVLAQGLSKPVMTNPQLDSNYEARANNDLYRDLPAHSYTWQNWDNNYIPQSLTSIYYPSDSFKYSVYDVETRNVQFSDCPHSNAVSRHKGASQSWTEILDMMSRVPVGMRQYISNVLVLPRDAVTVGAYAGGTTVVFNGAYVTLGVWAHESVHVLDIAALNDVVTSAGYASGTRYSTTSMWSGAYDKDSHVITAYGKSAGHVENFAEIGRWELSDTSLPGGIGTYIGNNWSLFVNQLYNYKDRLGRKVFPGGWPQGGQCTGKVVTTAAVSKATGALLSASTSRVAGKNLEWADRVTKGAEGIPVIETPEGMDSEPIPDHFHDLE